MVLKLPSTTYCLRKKLRPCLILPLLAFTVSTSAQHVSLSVKDASLESVFNEVKKQTGFSFVFTSEELAKSHPVTISIQNSPLKDALVVIFKNQPFAYEVDENYVVVKPKNGQVRNLNSEIKGRVVDEKDQGIEVATVKIKNSKALTTTDANGFFVLEAERKNAILIVSSVGFETREVSINEGLVIKLKSSIGKLDETIVIAYGTTTKRLSTGSIGKIKGEDIIKQPVSNVLGALTGRIPGLIITQSSGIPGAAFQVQIRGRTSINTNLNNDPLFIIDGMPYAPNNDVINKVPSSLRPGLSPFNNLNPSDIESIEILKDADATAIYGSRGANGVILITTKKGVEGKTKATFNLYSGISKVTRRMRMLNTQEYLLMRREAFANDGLIPGAVVGSQGYAPDLMIWDTTRYTDLSKELIGGTARTSDVQLSLSGGSANTQFFLSAGHHKETTVYPGDLAYRRMSFHSQVSHNTTNKKFTATWKLTYGTDRNNININDLTAYTNLPPNVPSFYDANGKLLWQSNGVGFENPYAYALREYVSETDNLIANMQLAYTIIGGLTARSNFGYNSIYLHDYNLTPINSQNPAYNLTGMSNFGTNEFKSYVIEPQLQYKGSWKKLKFDLLLGSTWLINTNENTSIAASGYIDDALLRSVAAAPVVKAINGYRQYKYAAVFGRTNLACNDKYILNITGRRDGSSRFGPGNQYSNFGSIGAGWMFSKEIFLRGLFPVISYGKLRLSYGTSGNDKIGDYAYLDAYAPVGTTYQDVPGMFPNALFNSNYAWEVNKKKEIAIELGFLKDRIYLTALYYSNRSSNQLVNYGLPAQSGLQTVLANFPATVENRGVELELSTVNLQAKNFQWNMNFHITIPKNQLVDFPKIEVSSYSYLQIGEPLSIYGGYRMLGVNPATGVFEFADKNGKAISSPTSADRIKNLGNLEPKFYGGFSNQLKFKNIEFDLFLEYKKQIGTGYAGQIYPSVLYPGLMYNQPAIVLSRWRNPGDVTDIQKFTARSGSPAYNAANAIRSRGSDIQKSDASYIRLKNAGIAYLFTTSNKKNLFTGSKVYFQGQNLYTITKFEGSDPENQELFRLPPLRTYVLGFQLSF